MRKAGKTEMSAIREGLNLTDEELAARAAAGSRPSFEELVSRYSLRLFHFLRSRSGSDEDVEDLVLEEEAREAGNLWLIARTMKPSEYQVLWLRYAEEMPVKEIARAMKRSLVGVRVLLHRSRVKLGKKLREPSPAAGLADAAAVGQRLSIP